VSDARNAAPRRPIQRCMRPTVAPSGTNGAAERASASHAGAKVNVARHADINGTRVDALVRSLDDILYHRCRIYLPYK